MLQFHTSHGTGKSQQISLKRRRKKSVFESQVEKNYGITRDELDVILVELSQQYNCQWAVVSTALLRDHGIRMSDMSIRDRFTTYLDPTIKKEPYTKQESLQLAKMFWVRGSNYAHLKDAFGNHGRGAIKKCLGSMARRGIRRLELYLCNEIAKLSEKQLLGSGYLKRYNLVNAICSQSVFKWAQYQYTYTLLYYFMANDSQSSQKIPKELALILYKRLAQMAETRQNQKRLFYNKIDPKMFGQIQENSDQKRRNYMNNYRKAEAEDQINDKASNSESEVEDEDEVRNECLSTISSYSLPSECLQNASQPEMASLSIGYLTESFLQNQNSS